MIMKKTNKKNYKFDITNFAIGFGIAVLTNIAGAWIYDKISKKNCDKLISKNN